MVIFLKILRCYALAKKLTKDEKYKKTGKKTQQKKKCSIWWLRRTLILITASSTIFFFKRFFIMVGFFLIGSSSSTSTEPKNFKRNIEPGPRLMPKISSESSESLPNVPAFLQPAWWFSTYAHVHNILLGPNLSPAQQKQKIVFIKKLERITVEKG